ncbi:MAG: carbon monoxide dehydrogenase, partial [Desulfobacteraceae bacterium]|nr:carbon monoxide dehydrogenase [Desulfobacteraceae bacterium]
MVKTDTLNTITFYLSDKVGGKIAQLGSRLIDSTAKKLAGIFFTSFSEMIGKAD